MNLSELWDSREKMAKFLNCHDLDLKDDLRNIHETNLLDWIISQEEKAADVVLNTGDAPR